MDIEEYKKLARNKIEADALTQQVRDVIKITKWQKQDMREGFKETFKPLIKSQDSIKKSIDDQQNATLAQLQANQLALTQGLNRNRMSITEGLKNLATELSYEKKDDEDGGTSGTSGEDSSSTLEGEEYEEAKEFLSSKSDKKSSKIAKFTKEDLDRHLNNKKAQDILQENGYPYLPSYFIDKDMNNIINVINVTNDDLKETSVGLKIL